MPLLPFAKRFRSLQRLREIAMVLARHGFGHLVRRVGLQHLVPVRHRLAEPGVELGSAAARRAVLALQELGPTFVKLGQMLANRPDLLPPVWTRELRSLHDRVEPFDPDLALERIAAELGRPVEEVFADFDRAPFAAGSIAQCHHATLLDGTPVVVKVKRPGIEQVIFRDLELLEMMARLIERHIPEYRVYRPVMVVEELARTTKRELDFIGEATNTERFRRDLADFEQVGVPAVIWEATTANLLTLQRLGGENLLTLLERGEEALDRPALARLICDIFMHQFFVTGFFHADPHPGNLLVVPPARLNILDFGMAGHLTEEMKGHLATLVLALVARDLDVMVDVFEEIEAIGPRTTRRRFKTEILGLIDKYFSLPAGRLDIEQVFGEFTETARRNNVLLPREFAILGRSFVNVTSLAMRLDPELNLSGVLRPHAKRLVLAKLSPARIGRHLVVSAWHLSNLLGRLPRDLRDLSRRALRGQLQVTLEHRRLEALISEIDHASNRLAFAITIAALIVGSSLVIKMEAGPTVLGGLSVFGLLGYVVAGFMGLWLIVAIMRSGRL